MTSIRTRNEIKRLGGIRRATIAGLRQGKGGLAAQAHLADLNATIARLQAGRRPAPRRGRHGQMLHPTYGRGGELLWVTIPGKE